MNERDRLKKIDRVGRMDRRVSFLQKIVTDGESNEDYTNGWEKVASVPDVWAYKQDLKGREVVVADRVQMSFMTVWTIRYRTDIKASMRLVDESGQVYEIITLGEGEGRRSYTEVTTNILEGVFWT